MGHLLYHRKPRLQRSDDHLTKWESLQNYKSLYGIFMTAFRNKKQSQILNKITSSDLHSALLVI